VKYDTFLALFAFFMPIHEKASTLMIFICLFAFVLEVARKKVHIEWRKNLFIFSILYLLYVGTSVLLSDNIEFKWFEQKASFLIFPLLFSTAYKYNQKKILTAFVYGCFVAYVICFVLALKNSLVFESGNISFNPLLNESRGFGFFKSMIYEGNYFFGLHFSRLIQISYFALYLAFAISALMFRLEGFKGKYAIIIIFVIAILQTTSLAGIINLFTVIFIAVLFNLKSTTKKVFIVFGCLGLIMLSTRYHPKINATAIGAYKTLQNQNSPEYPKQPRLMTWKAAIMAVKQHGMIGVGIGNSQKALNKEYSKIGFERGSNENLNTHNQYLQILLDCGVLGLVTLLFILCTLLKKTMYVESYEKPFVLCFFLLIVISFMFESMLNRYVGISFFAFFVSMLLQQDNKIRLN
tara:strand:- start:6841 stop:8064 length:1224 start_codon:yes stop_codon:yes gene_type:complete